MRQSSTGRPGGSDLQAGVVGYVCRSADVNLWMEVGVGYAPGCGKAINEFLSLFHVESFRYFMKPIMTRPIYEAQGQFSPA
jgi:hypothetical protein